MHSVLDFHGSYGENNAGKVLIKVFLKSIFLSKPERVHGGGRVSPTEQIESTQVMWCPIFYFLKELKED